ncbi:hypothetical protein Rfer_4431 (plasmid) [Rhodoferax ferrireducens T118]|uniref:Uncharacterized protein n=1 Tax=Albidiferax ferrireducens (strain ATCC BAA-621 / DSM 15236 / T118) TaxID=338969 RepID=Q21Q28_ALBFT|nr:hypothetical protein [Rhodoferax ferrireducens]ABD72117.1 hypothetical protein Rfer_4431 [Rhodoferax ferrireducens T118]
MTLRPQLFEHREPAHVHDFAPGHQKRSGDQQVIVDRLPSAVFGYTFGIYLERYSKLLVWTQAEVTDFVKRKTVLESMSIAGDGIDGRKWIAELNTNESVGLMAVLTTWV